jgi:uncharacterized repeat protein (TIGR01451 family)
MGNHVSLRSRKREIRRRRRRPAWELMEQRQLLSTFVVTNTNDDSNPNSLRWAILQANGASGTSTISFNIPGSGVQSIKVSSPLPTLVNPVKIDGTSEPNYAGSPLIELDGSALASGSNGLVLTGGGSTVSGLAIVGFAGSGLVLESAGGNVVTSSYLGVLPSGTKAEANGVGISIIGSATNTIGGTSSGAGNLISGNTDDGILIENTQSDSSGNLIAGNLIGTAIGGTTALGNGECGIEIEAATQNQIGASGFGLNVVAGNGGAGVEIGSSASGTTIQNNNIGVGADGVTALGNGGDGILLNGATSTQIGGTSQLAANLIGCNLGNGINLEGGSTGETIQGNDIGTDSTGQLKLGNYSSGVSLASSSNTIGGQGVGAGNLLYYNGVGGLGAGVSLVGNPVQDSILSNSIYMNAGLGINLGDGPTPNHAPGTPGPNNYQNYPVLSSAVSDGSATTVAGSLSESPSTQYLLQFFSSPTEDSSGFGQGKLFLGSTYVQTGANGIATFSVPINEGCAPGSYISATATDPAGDTSEFCLDVRTQGQINLVLTGSAAPNPVLAGDDLTYTLAVSNNGSIDAHVVGLTDQLPGGTTLVSASTSQGYIVPSMNKGVVMATLGTLAAGSSATVTITVQTATGVAGTITDTASVSSQETDPYPSSENVSLTTSVELGADVSVAIAAAPSPVLVGGDLTYTLTVSNLGPSTASNVIAALPLPATTSFVSATASTGTATFASGQVTANLGDIKDGDLATVTVVVQANSVGQVSATASASSENIDPNLSNNSATITTAVEASADLSVVIGSSASEVADGIDFTYTVTVTNNGPSSDSGVTISDTLPAGVNFVSASSDQGVTPTYSGGTVTLALPTLNAGASAILSIVADPTAPPGSSLTDAASAAGQVADPNSANNSATLTLPVRGVSDLGISAVAGPSSVYQGQEITYTITATNQGPADEPNAVITGQLPGTLSFVSAASQQGSAPSVNENGVFTADLGLLPANHTAVVTLIAIPVGGSVGTLPTTFAISGQNVDTNPVNNTTSTSVSVAPSTSLSVSISPGSQPACELVDWTYTLVVANQGYSNATGVRALAPLPANAQLVSATSSQGAPPTVQNGSVTAALGVIATGQSATLTLVLQPQAAGLLSLAGLASGNEFDLEPANEQASATINVSPSVNLSVSLTPSSQTILTGHALSCTAIVTNSGPATATNVLLSLPLSSVLVYNSSTTTQGTSTGGTGLFVAQLGNLASGSSATVNITLTASIPATITETASISSSEHQLNQQGNAASATIVATESPGVLEFAASSIVVPETAGLAVLSVERTDGTIGSVSVRYQTVAVNATPGLDFVPTSGTLTFAAGQSTAAILIPVLANPWDNHDEYLSVVLSSPTGGALLGTPATASLRIIDVDPDMTPPQVAQLSWIGTARSISSVNLAFSAPLDPGCATNAANYALINMSAGGRAIALGTPQYNATTHSVTLVPTAPLAAGQYYEVVVQAGGTTGIHDIAGLMLDGAGTGNPGTNYVASFAQGTKLQYVDSSGNRVMLRLTGPGYLEQVRNQAGDGVVLNVVGEVPHRTTLSGTVHATKGKRARTNLGIINGLGQFGDVKVLLTSPPFFVRQFPFFRRGHGVL